VNFKQRFGENEVAKQELVNEIAAKWAFLVPKLPLWNPFFTKALLFSKSVRY